MANFFTSRFWNGDGSAVAVPTFTVADNGDGTGGVVTIAGSTPGATNTLYYAAQVPGASFAAFATTRVGDGTIAINLAAATYFGYIHSSLAGGAQNSLVGSFTLSANSVSPVTTHWWLDVKTTKNGDGENIMDVGFFPVGLQEDHEPTALCSLRDRPGSYSNVILGCRDGYLRRYQSNLAQDDGTNFSWHYDIGPIPCGGGSGWEDGIVSEISAVTAASSGDVDWALRVGNNAEAAFNASTFASGEWNDAGFNYHAQPRARGHAFVIRISGGESNTKAAMEELRVVLESGGKMRR